MNLKTTFSVGLIFLTSILCGMILGSRARLAHAQTPDANPVAQILPTMENGQVNVLIIITDRLGEKNIHLESVWLANYQSESAPLKLFPIYPNRSDGKILDTNKLAKSFRLTIYNDLVQLGPKFTEILQDRNFSWSGFIVVDRYALSELVDVLGGVNISGARLNGKQFYQYLPRTADSPETAYEYYANFWQAMCINGKQSLSGIGWEESLKLLPEHIATDLKPDYLFDAWRGFFSVEKASACEFPLNNAAELDRQTVHFSTSTDINSSENP